MIAADLAFASDSASGPDGESTTVFEHGLENHSLAYRQVLSEWATGVSVVASVSEDQAPVGCTVNAFSSVSLEPPLVMVCLSEGSRTLTATLSYHSFGVSILTSAQEEVASIFAGAGVLDDKFERVEWRFWHTVPVISDALCHLACEVWDAVPAGDHRLILGRVTSGRTLTSAAPLLFVQSNYVSAMSLGT